MSVVRLFFIIILFLSSTLFASVGKVSLLKGEATVERNAVKTALQNGSTLEAKDIIKTSKDAQIQLIFEDKTVITLGGESDFKIEEYLNDAINSKAKFKFNQGTFKTITGQIGKTAPENFTLETKTATIGIRGTIVGGIVSPTPPPPPPGMPPPPPAPDVLFCLGGMITATSLQTGVTVTLPVGTMTLVSPSGPPSPPRQTTPQDLERLNEGLGNTPPALLLGGNQRPSGNTPPTQGEGGGDTPPPARQNFVPTAANDALQNNLETLAQDGVIENIANELNVSVDVLKDQIQNKVCPAGTSGTFPICIATSCPQNTTGVYPNCIALTCPAGTTGTYPDCGTCTGNYEGVYPNCTLKQCPSGTTGTYPNCGTCTVLQSGTYPNCVNLTCPAGTTGTYPDCGTCTGNYEGVYPNCTLKQCPSGTTGTFPDCGTCTASQSGTYPNCVDLTCEAGTNPDCSEQSYYPVRAFATELISATPTCPENSTGTYPNCIPFQLTGFATSMYDTLQDGNLSISIADTLLIGATETALSGAVTLDINSSVQVDISEFATVNTINDFNNTKIWTLNTAPNDYVSWGYWTSPELDGNKTLLAGTNYWVAGKDAAAAATYIGTLPANTHYIYSGKALGKVNGLYDIDPVNDATNSVQLKFNFGGGSNSIINDPAYSWIKFKANGQSWELTPTASFSGGSFTGSVGGSGITGAIKGQFFGTEAQAVGGTFSATDGTNKALGVFKAVR